MKPKDRKVIGETTCVDCGATVELRVNAGGRVYSNCDGAADPEGRTCYASLTYSKRKSVAMIKEAEANDSEEERSEEIEPETVERDGTGTPIGGALKRGRQARGSLYDSL